MAKVISASFAVRSDADMAIEHLVQEYDISADAIEVVAASVDNSSGVAPSGGDSGRGDHTMPRLAGRISVSVDVDEAIREKVQTAFHAYLGTCDVT